MGRTNLGTLLLLVMLPVKVLGAESVADIPEIDELIQLSSIRGAVLSPDAEWVAYGVRKADFDSDSYVTQLWLAKVDGSLKFQLTRGNASASGANWAPDGKWLTFLRQSDGKSQVFAIRPNGGEALRLSDCETSVRGFEWAPDGESIVFLATDKAADQEKAREKHFSGFQVFRRDYRFSHLWVLDVREAILAPQKGEKLTQGKDFSVTSFSISPDSRKVAFGGANTPDLVDRGSSDIYVLDLSDKSVDKIVEQPGPDSNPMWSPDGRELAFSTAMGRTLYYADNSQLAKVPSSGGKVVPLTKDFDEDSRLEFWGADGIYFSAFQKTASHLFRLDPSDLRIVRISGPGELMAWSFSLSKSGKNTAFLSYSPTSVADVFVSEVESFSPRQLTNMTSHTENLVLASRELISWESKDGTTIEGVLLKPRDFDPMRRYPLLCVIHGGPTGIDRPGLLARGTSYYPVDIWAGRGALVLSVNYRGSAGYGEAFRKLNMRNLGVGDAWDVLSGVQHLVDKGWVDSERVGCMGWSQGGYISAFLTTSSDQFAAISVGAGISNWATYYYNTDITPFTINYLGDDPADDPKIYEKTSPMSYIRDAKTPTLIQHGEFDRRVPTANAFELRQGLEDRGVPVELVIYKGFGHGISKPKAMRAVMKHNLDWFNHYLWGDPLPDFTSPETPDDEEGSEEEK